MKLDKTRAENLPLVREALGFGQVGSAARHPVWFMRQAGRYLPEYMAIRSRMEFVDLCRSPKDAAEVTLQPLRRFDLDAAIIFSDILVPCMALGQTLTFGKGHGPQLAPAMRSREDFRALKRPDVAAELGYVGDAISLTKSQLAPGKALIGFAGAPFTVATYMIEGGSSKEFTATKAMIFRDPALFADFMKLLRDVTVDYLLMQVRAGADALMLFDTWAGNLTPDDYARHVWPVTADLMATVRESTGVPVTYFSGQGSDRILELGRGAKSDPATRKAFDVLSVDWRVRIPHAARLVKEAALDVALQGNLDPQVLIGPEQLVRERVRSIMEEVHAARSAGLIHGHIFNVGHGLLPHTPPEALSWAIDEVRKQSAQGASNP
ncbi:uroporphyrinogen decarboxylase [bacterium]|nr:uroporphyrinogen decarboxylase [bacterium]